MRKFREGDSLSGFQQMQENLAKQEFECVPTPGSISSNIQTMNKEQLQKELVNIREAEVCIVSSSVFHTFQATLFPNLSLSLKLSMLVFAWFKQQQASLCELLQRVSFISVRCTSSPYERKKNKSFIACAFMSIA